MKPVLLTDNEVDELLRCKTVSILMKQLCHKLQNTATSMFQQREWMYCCLRPWPTSHPCVSFRHVWRHCCCCHMARQLWSMDFRSTNRFKSTISARIHAFVGKQLIWFCGILENMLTLAVCMYCNECCIAIIWCYSHLWICSRSDTVCGVVSKTVKICLGKVLKKSLNWWKTKDYSAVI